MDMQDDIFARTAFGQAALKKLGSLPAGFRLFSAGWLGDDLRQATVMKVSGAEFRAAKTGPNKGKLSIRLAGTTRTAYVTKPEMAG